MPRGGVVHAGGEVTLSTSSRNTLGVLVEGTTLFLDQELGAVRLSLGTGAIHEVLGPVKVGTGGCFVVLHDTTWGEAVVQHVGGGGESEQQAEADGNTAGNISAHADALVGDGDGLLELGHVLLRGKFARL